MHVHHLHFVGAAKWPQLAHLLMWERPGAHERTARAQAGVSTELQLRDAEAQRLSARLDLVDALVDAQVAAAQLDVALGRGRVEEDR